MQRLSPGDDGQGLLENAVGTVRLLYQDITSAAARTVLPHEG